MLSYDLKRAKKAVQFLVDSTFGKHHMRKIRTYSLKPRAMPFKGEAEVLNELVLIGRQDQRAMENLLALVENKRDDRGDYQREYMAQKRGRERKAIQLQEFLAGRPLTLDERRHLLMKQTEVWGRERDQYIAQATKAHIRAQRKEPTWLEKTGFIKAFWAIKDKELEELIDAAAAQPKIAHRKRTVRVEPPRPTRNPALHDKLKAKVRR